MPGLRLLHRRPLRATYVTWRFLALSEHRPHPHSFGEMRGRVVGMGCRFDGGRAVTTIPQPWPALGLVLLLLGKTTLRLRASLTLSRSSRWRR